MRALRLGQVADAVNEEWQIHRTRLGQRGQLIGVSRPAAPGDGQHFERLRVDAESKVLHGAS
jgi:hypothetical protein